MHGQLRTIVLATSLAFFSASESVAETRTMSGEKEEPPPPPGLAVGDTAPDFTLHDQERNEVSLLKARLLHTETYCRNWINLRTSILLALECAGNDDKFAEPLSLR